MSIDETKWYMIRDTKTGKVWTANGKAARQTQVTLEKEHKTVGDDNTVIAAQQWAIFEDRRLKSGETTIYSKIRSRLEQNTIITYADQDAATHENTPITVPGEPIRMFLDVQAPSGFWTLVNLGVNFLFRVAVGSTENLSVWTDGTDLTMQGEAKDANGKPTSDPQAWIDQGYAWEFVELGSIEA